MLDEFNRRHEIVSQSFLEHARDSNVALSVKFSTTQKKRVQLPTEVKTRIVLSRCVIFCDMESLTTIKCDDVNAQVRVGSQVTKNRVRVAKPAHNF